MDTTGKQLSGKASQAVTGPSQGMPARWTSRWAYLLRRLALVLGAYFVLRVVFLIYHHALFADATAAQIARAFLYGLRFDLSAIIATNLPFILLTFLPRNFPPRPGYQRLLKGIFLALNFPFLVINIIDLEFFQFTGRRATFDLARMATDAGVKWTTMTLYYWPLVILGLVLMAALFLLFDWPSAVRSLEVRRSRVWSWASNWVLVGLLSVLAIRGGLQMRPLVPAQAMALGHRALAPLALNSTFTLIKSYQKTGLKRYDYFRQWPELLAYLRTKVDGEKLLPAPDGRDNVVILILESLAAEYCGVGHGGPRYTPFLDSLAAQSLFFQRHYANGRRSIEAIPSILAGLPSLMDEAFLESVYCDNGVLGLGTLLDRQGYTTSFFHGGKNGTMRFDLFMRMAGIQNYFGRNEYPHASDFDGDWGIFDEPFLQFTVEQLSRQKPPFAAVVFTLTAHHPYPIPEKYRGRFPKGTLEIHESIGYADYALQQFFATARQQPWYSNTLFVITADHTQKLETPEYANPLGEYRVPLLFFHPRKQFTMVEASRITQHVDILPSVLDYLNIEPDQRLLFGRSIFRRGEGRAFLHANGRYWLVRGARVLEFVPGQASQLFDLARDPFLKSPLQEKPEHRREMEREAQALVQYFNNGLLDHRLYDRTEGSASDR